jgi:hypothetical protein
MSKKMIDLRFIETPEIKSILDDLEEYFNGLNRVEITKLAFLELQKKVHTQKTLDSIEFKLLLDEMAHSTTSQPTSLQENFDFVKDLRKKKSTQ